MVSAEQIGNLTATIIDGFAMLHQDLQMLIETMQYPPKIADFREVVGVSVRRNEQLVGIEGPTFGTRDGNSAMYTADMDRVNKMMADLDKELAGMRN